MENLREKKQTKEMAKVIKSSLDGLGCGNFNFTGVEISTMFAKALYNAGYRKQSDGEWESLSLDVHEALKHRAVENARAEVAREIFEEIEKKAYLRQGDWHIHFKKYDELKKKYTEIATPKEERCVVCDETIPEGRQVCPNCEQKEGVNHDGS